MLILVSLFVNTLLTGALWAAAISSSDATNGAVILTLLWFALNFIALLSLFKKR